MAESGSQTRGAETFTRQHGEDPKSSDANQGRRRSKRRYGDIFNKEKDDHCVTKSNKSPCNNVPDSYSNAKQGNDISSVGEVAHRKPRENRYWNVAQQILSKRVWVRQHFSQDTRRMKRRMEFTVMTYNILAQRYLMDNMYLYGHCPSFVLAWEFRRDRLLNEITYHRADILCFQEMEPCVFKDFQYQLKHLGYIGHYVKKTGDKPDGCATFFKRRKFSLAAVKCVRFNKKVDVLDRDNVALILLLKVHRFGHKKIVVGNTHLLFNPKRGDVRLAQTALLLSSLEEVSFKKETVRWPVIMCGDFNTDPFTPLYTFLTAGHLRYEGIPRHLVSETDFFTNKAVLLSRVLLPRSLGISDQCIRVKSFLQRCNKQGTQYSRDKGNVHSKRGLEDKDTVSSFNQQKEKESSGEQNEDKGASSEYGRQKIETCSVGQKEDKSASSETGEQKNQTCTDKQNDDKSASPESGSQENQTYSGRHNEDRNTSLETGKQKNQTCSGRHNEDKNASSESGKQNNQIGTNRQNEDKNHTSPPSVQKDLTCSGRLLENKDSDEIVVQSLSQRESKDQDSDPRIHQQKDWNQSEKDLTSPLNSLTFETGQLSHTLNLRSVYDHCLGWTGRPGEREITTHHSRASATVDYIFYSTSGSGQHFSGNLQLRDQYSLLSDEDLKQLGSLPNRFLGSDHLSLLAKFALD
ncbi:protein angel homolog 2 isoform X1 [Lingula anatina]|uniref:Protein angel homolog 2 isoform X1 n=1 Tax=Lingula anatina TaxID=7574 RepID=A0A1S3IST9_LINAN|nr:protein angel homolog 2 isoform X1 [Lingula anatina]|eukprot:XP_013400594.1 protein angel homolog 2 isoform X1 [Lingula anatina]